MISASANSIRIETVGPPIKGVNVKLSKNSELYQGNCLMKGYWKDVKATKETLKDGWLHTETLLAFMTMDL